MPSNGPVFTGANNQYLNVRGSSNSNPGSVGIGTTPFTFLTLIRMTDTGATWQGIFQAGKGVGMGGGAGFWMGSQGLTLYSNIGQTGTGSFGNAVAGNWTLIAACIRGDALRTYYVYDFATSTWNVNAYTATSSAPLIAHDGSMVRIGNFNDTSGNDAFSEPLNSDPAWMGVWAGDLSGGGGTTPSGLVTFVNNGPWNRIKDSDCKFFVSFDKDLTAIPDEAAGAPTAGLTANENSVAIGYVTTGPNPRPAGGTGATFSAALASGTVSTSTAAIKSGVNFSGVLATATAQSQIVAIKAGTVFSSALATASAQGLTVSILTGTKFLALLATANTQFSIVILQASASFVAQLMQVTSSAYTLSFKTGALWLAQAASGSGVFQSSVMRTSNGILASVAFSTLTSQAANILSGVRITAGLMSANTQMEFLTVTLSGKFLAQLMQITLDMKNVSFQQSNNLLAQMMLANALSQLVQYKTEGRWFAGVGLVNVQLRFATIGETFTTTSPGPDVIYAENVVPMIVNAMELIPYLYTGDSMVPSIYESAEV